jgi:peptidoglycan/LPS O-acetylase OafA/YrhL
MSSQLGGARPPEGYRPDVDGLRAVAVLSVIIFHLSKQLLPGGFLGVDIFFVISGYLITRNILQGVTRGTFTIGEFYRRRIKRIAPVLLVVVAFTLAASYLLQLPEDFRTTAKSAVFSLASLANVYFWKFQDTSYFAIDSAQIPLLHLWSLGVEEQFYLIWPVLLLLIYRPTRARKLFITAVVVAIVSFILGDLLYDRAPSFTYYMLPTRAGELLVGALVAMAVLQQIEHRIASAAIPVMATIGVVILAASLFLITENQPFPGWRAIPPTSATGLLILAGHCGDNAWSRLLSWKPLVWTGLISYSAYLWHWPLLALFRYGYGEPSFVAGAVLFALTIILAWLTYQYVERPTRQSSGSLLRVFVRQYAVPGGVLVVLAVVAIYSPRLGVSLHTADYQRRLSDTQTQTRPAYAFSWVCQRQRFTLADARNPHCVLGRPAAAAPNAILWGDSHAAHYIGMVDAFAINAGFRFRNAAVGSCPPLFSDPSQFVDSRRAADCRASLDILRPLVKEFPVVIVSSAWLDHGANNSKYLNSFFDTARQLAAMGKLVIVIGEAPWMPGYDRRCSEKALSYPLLRCPHAILPLAPAIAKVNAQLRQFAARTPNVRYFDATSYLCPGGACAAFSPDGEPRYYDPSHLNMMASSRLGREIVARDGVPTAFSLVADWAQSNHSELGTVQLMQ